LSFRVFEAMAYQKKIITNNKSIMEYDFYNPNNILVLQNNTYEFESSFFETAYQPIAKEIYDKYTVQSWVKKIFNLN
jgi:predicted secreted protein